MLIFWVPLTICQCFLHRNSDVFLSQPVTSTSKVVTPSELENGVTAESIQEDIPLEEQDNKEKDSRLSTGAKAKRKGPNYCKRQKEGVQNTKERCTII